VKGWARAWALAWAVAAAGCGGGGSTTPSAAATPASGDAIRLVQLEAGNFDALVLSGGRVALVEFHSPT
jgi:hypothetical protein